MVFLHLKPLSYLMCCWTSIPERNQGKCIFIISAKVNTSHGRKKNGHAEWAKHDL